MLESASLAKPAVGRRYLLGAPWKEADRKRYLDAWRDHLRDDEKVTERIERFLARTTDKSVGLLQAVSIFAAVAIFLMDGRTEGLTSIALVVMFIAALLLIANLGVVWHAGERALPEADYSVYVLNIAVWRAVKFTLAYYLSLAAFALVSVQFGLNWVHREALP